MLIKQAHGYLVLSSRAFVSYYGLPEEFPKADSAEDILAESSWRGNLL